MNFRRLEKVLTDINELSTALILVLISLLTLGKYAGIEGSHVIEITVEKPQLKNQLIGHYKTPDGDIEEVWVDAPVQLDGRYVFLEQNKVVNGFGQPSVEIKYLELVLPVLGEPAYIVGYKAGGDQYYKPNIQYIGSGQYYQSKELHFDGANEHSYIRQNFEAFLGGVAILLLLLRVILRVILHMKVQPMGGASRQVIDQNETHEELTWYSSIDKELLVRCAKCSDLVLAKDVMMTKLDEDEYSVCPDCIGKFIAEKERRPEGLRLDDYDDRSFE